jgi:hypothetical protein
MQLFPKIEAPRLAAAVLLVFFLFAIACEDFYTLADTPTPGSTPTQVPPGALPTDEFDLARNLLDRAREALEIRIGRAAPDLRLDSIDGSPFTRSSPGCLPPPGLYDSNYNLPGIVAGVINEGIRYEFHADAIRGERRAV